MKNITRYILIGVGVLILVGLGIILFSKVKVKEYYKLVKYDSVYAVDTDGTNYSVDRLKDYEYFYIELGTKNTFKMTFKLSETFDKNQNEYSYEGTYTKEGDVLTLEYKDYSDEMVDGEPRKCIYNYNSETKLWERSEFINITDGDGVSTSRYTLVQNLKVTRSPK